MSQTEQCHVIWEKELAKGSRQRRGRGKVVNGAQVRVHMQVVVEVLQRQRQGECEAVNDYGTHAYCGWSG